MKRKENPGCYRQIPNENQNETQHTQKKSNDNSENFKANPGIFSHAFYKVWHFDVSIKYALSATTVI